MLIVLVTSFWHEAQEYPELSPQSLSKHTCQGSCQSQVNRRHTLRNHSAFSSSPLNLRCILWSKGIDWDPSLESPGIALWRIFMSSTLRNFSNFAGLVGAFGTRRVVFRFDEEGKCLDNKA